MFESEIAALKNTKFTPYWLDSSDCPETEKTLIDHIKTDLLIVGSGFTGLWAAVQAKEQNPERDVVVIEANTAAIGASGRPGAILSPSLMHGVENTHRLYEPEMAELERLGQENMDQYRRRLRNTILTVTLNGAAN